MNRRRTAIAAGALALVALTGVAVMLFSSAGDGAGRYVEDNSRTDDWPSARAIAPGSARAVLVATSSGPDSIRHRSDMLEAYRLLRARGMSDDEILLLVDDADAPRRGATALRSTHDDRDLVRGAVLDGRPIELDAPRIAARVAKFLAATPAGSDVFASLTGHADRVGLWIGPEQARGEQLTPGLLAPALSTARRARSLTVTIDACYSGAFLRMKLPARSAVVTASTATEKSYADAFDQRDDVWRSNEFGQSQLRQLAHGAPSLEHFIGTLRAEVDRSGVQSRVGVGVPSRPRWL